MNAEHIIVGLIIALAVFYLFKKIRNAFKGGGCSCGCGDGCAARPDPKKIKNSKPPTGCCKN